MTSWLIKQWYDNPSPSLILRLISLLYRLIIRLRLMFYRFGIFKQTRLPVPVIVVGNVTVGGTGKTPLVIYIAQALIALGYRPAVISRGYGRARHTPMRVKKNMSAAQVGDEPLMMSAHLPCPIWVGARRIETAKRLLSATPQVDVILCDDGLQHYALARDIEVLVFDAERGIGNGYLLPAGPLREPVSRIQSADFAVINGKPTKPWGWLKQIAQVQMHFQLGKLAAVNDKVVKQKSKMLSSLKGKKVHVVAGIGNPDRFFKALRAQGLIVQPHAFQDHHDYQVQDFDDMQDAPIIMTEKDAVKCREFHLAQAWFVPITASLDAKLIKYLDNRLQTLRGQHG